MNIKLIFKKINKVEKSEILIKIKIKKNKKNKKK
jgi:hypothetical protein